MPNFYTTKSFSKVWCRAQKISVGHKTVYAIDPWNQVLHPSSGSKQVSQPQDIVVTRSNLCNVLYKYNGDHNIMWMLRNLNFLFGIQIIWMVTWLRSSGSVFNYVVFFYLVWPSLSDEERTRETHRKFRGGGIRWKNSTKFWGASTQLHGEPFLEQGEILLNLSVSLYYSGDLKSGLVRILNENFLSGFQIAHNIIIIIIIYFNKILL